MKKRTQTPQTMISGLKDFMENPYVNPNTAMHRYSSDKLQMSYETPNLEARAERPSPPETVGKLIGATAIGGGAEAFESIPAKPEAERKVVEETKPEAAHNVVAETPYVSDPEQTSTPFDETERIPGTNLTIGDIERGGAKVTKTIDRKGNPHYEIDGNLTDMNIVIGKVHNL